MAKTWASDIGLPQLADTLLMNLVDGRVLNSFSKDDLHKYPGKLTVQFTPLSWMELIVYLIYYWLLNCVVELSWSCRGCMSLTRSPLEAVRLDPDKQENKIKQWLNQIDLQVYSPM